MSASAPLHRSAADRWPTMRLEEQLANVGSEVGRTLKARATGNDARLQGALARALELFDLTAADTRWRGARRREILRTREAFCGASLDRVAEPGLAKSLERYFLAFAVLANRRRADRSS